MVECVCVLGVGVEECGCVCWEGGEGVWVYVLGGGSVWLSAYVYWVWGSVCVGCGGEGVWVCVLGVG